MPSNHEQRTREQRAYDLADMAGAILRWQDLLGAGKTEIAAEDWQDTVDTFQLRSYEGSDLLHLVCEADDAIEYIKAEVATIHV